MLRASEGLGPEIVNAGIDTALKRETTLSQARINDPPIQPPAPPPSNIMLRTWRMGEKMGKKSIFLEIFACKCLNFLKFSNVNWIFAQKPKKLPLGFFISFRIINDFQ